MDGFDAAQVSSLIGINISSLTIVSLILNVILPFIVVLYAMYLLLCKIHIFRNRTVNATIGAVMSFLTLRFGDLAMWFGFAGIIVLKFDKWYDKALALAAFIIFITRITSIFSIQGALAVFCAAAALICILKIKNLPVKLTVVVIIYIIFWFLSVYLVLENMLKLKI